jgi:hypothetical protein
LVGSHESGAKSAAWHAIPSHGADAARVIGAAIYGAGVGS